jgi:short chain dehydrogenase
VIEPGSATASAEVGPGRTRSVWGHAALLPGSRQGNRPCRPRRSSAHRDSRLGHRRSLQHVLGCLHNDVDDHGRPRDVDGVTAGRLTDTTALVTGASRGFGRAVAVALRNAGANVVAVARSAEQVGESPDQLAGSLATVAADGRALPSSCGEARTDPLGRTDSHDKRPERARDPHIGDGRRRR